MAACCSECAAGRTCAGGSCSTGSSHMPKKTQTGRVFANTRTSIPNKPVFVRGHGGNSMVSSMVRSSGELTFEQQQAAEKQRFDEGILATKTALDAIFRGVDTAVKAANADKINEFNLAMQQSKERIALGESSAAAEMAKAQQMLTQLKNEIQQSKAGDSGETPEEQKGLPTWAVVLMAGGAVVVVGGVAYMIASKGKRRK